MDDLNTSADARPALDEPGAAAAPKQRRWLRFVLYPLALIGLLVIGMVAYMTYQARNNAAASGNGERTTFDQAQMVDTVMTDTYGKYSEEKRGWLYVHNDDQTYVMRVIHQVHMDDTPDGDQLYLLASGTPLRGDTETTVYGAFHVYPDPEKAGGLKQASSQEWVYGKPLKPEDVRFAKLSKTVWAWVIKISSGDGKDDVAREAVSIVAPHQEQIVTLAQFPVAARYEPGTDCAVLKQEYGAFSAANQADGDTETEPDEPLRCQDRRWSYKLGNGDTGVAAPITITVSGTEDRQPIDEKTWKVVFDSKVFRYLVPDDIEDYRSAAPAPAPAAATAAPDKAEDAPAPAPAPAPAAAEKRAEPAEAPTM